MGKLFEPVNALSIDLEEWYQTELMKDVYTPKDSLIEHPTEILLNILNKYNTRATFFIVGEVAKNNPELIKLIHREKHEIAIHGFTHSRLEDIGPEGFRHELMECKNVLRKILGDIEIKGFRAPSFSLNQNTNWAIDILKEFQIKYDSSLFPAKNYLYGTNGIPLNIYGINSDNIKVADVKSSLKEFPITAFEFWRFRFPISGGFFLRLIPIRIQTMFLKLINKQRPFIIYIHPWECSQDTPKIKLNCFSSFIFYYNIKSSLSKLEILLKNFKFDRIDNVLGV